MNRYVVWSLHTEPEPREVVEVTRTDRNAAYQDAAIFREICHRKSWVQDTEEGRK